MRLLYRKGTFTPNQFHICFNWLVFVSYQLTRWHYCYFIFYWNMCTHTSPHTFSDKLFSCNCYWLNNKSRKNCSIKSMMWKRRQYRQQRLDVLLPPIYYQELFFFFLLFIKKSHTFSHIFIIIINKYYWKFAIWI